MNLEYETVLVDVDEMMASMPAVPEPEPVPAATPSTRPPLPAPLSIDANPTHVLFRDGAFEIVSAHGVVTANPDLVALPSDYWTVPYRIDVVERVFIADATEADAVQHNAIDQAAGEVRRRFITEAPGQQLTYQRKEQEARSYFAGASIAELPFLAAEATATGLLPEAAALAIVQAADRWSAVGSAIEGARIAAKRAVSEASTFAGKRAAALVDWDAVIAAVEVNA